MALIQTSCGGRKRGADGRSSSLSLDMHVGEQPSPDLDAHREVVGWSSPDLDVWRVGRGNSLAQSGHGTGPDATKQPMAQVGLDMAMLGFHFSPLQMFLSCEDVSRPGVMVPQADLT